MIKWFLYLGHIIETFPSPIKDGFSKFQELFSQRISVGEYLLQFTILLKIPWIFTWKFIVKKEVDTSSTFLYRIVNVKWWDKLPEEQKRNMTTQGVVNYFTQSKGFGVQSTLENVLPVQRILSKDEEEELQRLLKAPTQEEMRRLFQEIKKGSSSSTKSDDDQSPSLFKDAQNPYDEFSPFD